MKNIFALIVCMTIIGCTGSSVQIIELNSNNKKPYDIYVMPIIGHGSDPALQHLYGFDIDDQSNLRTSIIVSLKKSNLDYTIYDVKKTIDVSDSDGTIIEFPIGAMKDSSYIIHLYLFTGEASQSMTVSCILEGKLVIYNSFKQCLFSKDLYIDEVSFFSVSDSKNKAIKVIVGEVLKAINSISH